MPKPTRIKLLKKLRKGLITDMRSGETHAIKWSGHWCDDRTKGVSIPFKDVPQMRFLVDRVYRIQFEYKDKRYPLHKIDAIVKLWGVDYIEDYS